MNMLKAAVCDSTLISYFHVKSSKCGKNRKINQIDCFTSILCPVVSKEGKNSMHSTLENIFLID